MDSNLTIKVDKEILRKATAYAENSGTTLSKLIVDYLNNIATRNDMEEQQLTPLVRELHGIAALNDNDLERESYFDHLQIKH